MAQFRFETLEIWQMAIEISDQLFDIGDRLREKGRYRFAEQIDGAGMSITNNISEGSGSFSDVDFANFLKFSRRSIFECANVLVIFQRRKHISSEEKEDLFNKLEHLSRKLTNFRKTLLK
ncbi:MAG: four helix bundle protein [Bacteroidales bacterium]|nr:four helix bundle protein [Bacteroidales bacterium]